MTSQKASLISQKRLFLQDLAPCNASRLTGCRLPGFIGLVPPPALDKSNGLYS